MFYCNHVVLSKQSIHLSEQVIHDEKKKLKKTKTKEEYKLRKRINELNEKRNIYKDD